MESRGADVSFLEGLEAMLTPGKRHEIEEKHKNEWIRHDPTDSDPYDGPIDLDSNTVMIRAPKAKDADEDEA